MVALRAGILVAFGLCALIVGSICSTSSGSGHRVRGRRLIESTPEAQVAVDRVVAFARGAAELSVVNAEALLAAIQSGDLEASKAAYLKLRPEYEQIEHLYEVFGDSDKDIDARPEMYDYGEAFTTELASTPGAVFKGSHRIETLLFRDQDVAAAVPWAEQLVTDYKALVQKLQTSEAYSAVQIFEGLIEVATEVAKKKFNSEEETWSDQSVLIFYNNLEGISQMFQHWETQLAAVNATLAAEVSEGLEDAAALMEPLVNTTADGSTYAPYSTVPIATRALIQAAFYEVADLLQEAAVALDIPVKAAAGGGEAEGEGEAEAEAEAGAEAEGEAGAVEEECTPTNTPTEYLADTPEMQGGLDYFRALMPYQIAASEAFTQAVEAGDLAAAEAAYQATRPIYEQVEVLAASFPSLDADLDAREYSFPGGEKSANFRGFHRLERLLFRDGDLGAETLAYAQGVETTLDTLQATLNSTNPQFFTAASAFDGLMSLASEVVSKKVSSEEETSSDLSQLIYYNNWKGIYSQAIPFCSLAQTECDAYAAATKAAVDCLDIETTDVVDNVGASAVNQTFIDGLLEADYKGYSEVSMETRRCIVQKGYAVRDTLVAFANALNVVDDCSPFHSSAFLTYTPSGDAAATTEAAGAGAPAGAPVPASSAAALSFAGMLAAAAVGVATCGLLF
ncbi:hypothetical protein D9Q98_003812 [Chlorella vulgaris]|uniref:Imelysin-like domain-containing protein n=1 Tax=Chlorella vulgaris TaxID=3077 RepID=A0A9D4YXY6_CHLVU|nr:hypothetical protein D9Q98_003812 [Chlorella vulgaris]